MNASGSVRQASEEEGSTRAGRNRPARASAYCALAAVAALGNLAGPAGWLNPGIFVGMAFLCSLVAVIAGHLGRFRGRRLGGEGRGLALAGLVTGWVVLLVCRVLLLAVVGVIAGLTLLVDSA
ncbi:DUF4190 domain-containing protein [Streptomyces buecherae]|uniref:DUF4190 domain-containing protein n=1 Tax=Streptomyces buecherae TaxID=2763006 RepID=A0A7H8N3S1_9ACTN|nr:DUF4190 domain-containing protein [Streptomyces buecherae]QKW49046.1 DUF4190 domain-containing protein [Streptomyces buecherae]